MQEKSFFIIEKIKKYRKCPALCLTHKVITSPKKLRVKNLRQNFDRQSTFSNILLFTDMLNPQNNSCDHFNPLMPKRYFCTSILFIVLYLQENKLQAVNTDLFNPLVPKVHNSECQNILFPLQIKPMKAAGLSLQYCPNEKRPSFLGLAL